MMTTIVTIVELNVQDDDNDENSRGEDVEVQKDEDKSDEKECVIKMGPMR